MRGASLPNVVAWLLRCRAAISAASVRGAVDSCTTARLAGANDREAVEGWWLCCPRLFLGGEAWWGGRLGAFGRAGAMRAPPGPLTESRIMS